MLTGGRGRKKRGDSAKTLGVPRKKEKGEKEVSSVPPFGLKRTGGEIRRRPGPDIKGGEKFHSQRRGGEGGDRMKKKGVSAISGRRRKPLLRFVAPGKTVKERGVLLDGGPSGRGKKKKKERCALPWKMDRKRPEGEKA